MSNYAGHNHLVKMIEMKNMILEMIKQHSAINTHYRSRIRLDKILD